MKQRPSAIPSRCDILITIKLEINLSVINGLYPRFKTFLSEKIDKRFTLVPKKRVEYVRFLSSRYTNVWVFVDMLVDNVVCKRNFLKCFCSRNYDFPCRKDAAGNLFHVVRWFELNLNCAVSIWFKGYLKYIFVCLEPLRHFH